MTSFDLADQFIAALERGDEAAVRQCYSPDALIWHNFDGLEQTVDDNVASLHWLRSMVDNIRYEDIRRDSISGGFLQQHVLTGTVKGGKPISMPACVIFQVTNNRIVRLEEYLDPAPLLRQLN